MIYYDDSIMVKGKYATAGSRMLESFKAPFTAAVIERLEGEELLPLALGEFGLEPPKELKAPLICNDVFGAVRKKASELGLCYIRPTYGTVSRYGLIPAACSMDQVGVICESPEQGLELLGKIAGNDLRDGAMFPEKGYTYGGKPESVRMLDYENELAEPVFNILAYGELSCNISRYDGIKFGYRAAEFRGLEELYIKTRTSGFGEKAKLAALAGCLALCAENYDKYYDKALRLRRLIRDSISFAGCDIVRVPAGSPYAALAGLPSLTFNGAEYLAGPKNEAALVAAWEAVSV